MDKLDPAKVAYASASEHGLIAYAGVPETGVDPDKLDQYREYVFPGNPAIESLFRIPTVTTVVGRSVSVLEGVLVVTEAPAAWTLNDEQKALLHAQFTDEKPVLVIGVSSVSADGIRAALHNARLRDITGLPPQYDLVIVAMHVQHGSKLVYRGPNGFIKGTGAVKMIASTL